MRPTMLFPTDEFQLLLERTYRRQRNRHGKLYHVKLRKIRQLTTPPPTYAALTPISAPPSRFSSAAGSRWSRRTLTSN